MNLLLLICAFVCGCATVLIGMALTRALMRVGTNPHQQDEPEPVPMTNTDRIAAKTLGIGSKHRRDAFAGLEPGGTVVFPPKRRTK